MVKQIVKLAKWLENRFPEKVILTYKDYTEIKTRIVAMDAEINVLRADLTLAKTGLEIIVSRLGTVETTAVHKGAVQELVAIVKGFKEEMATLRVNLGFNRPGNKEIQAMLNGEAIMEDSNG